MKYIITISFLITALFTLAQPKSIEFKPTVFYHNFSYKFPPALTVQPGDTIKSESVDAGGSDKNGTRLTKGGNPLTGPFYINGASPGDILAITLTTVSLNRDYAVTTEGFVKRAFPKKAMKGIYGHHAKLIKWTLMRDSGYAQTQSVHEHLNNFKVPLNPFMGCVGVAAPAKRKAPLTYFADEYGGNMDFYKVTEGATIYLPVFHEGALLYIGDGHAGQGDGEINGNALETSMNFAFVTRVIKGAPQLSFPRIEDSEHIVSMAMDKTLERALIKATQELVAWVQHDYHLSLDEATQVIGTSIEYRIPTLAGPKLEIAAMIKKKILIGLKNKKFSCCGGKKSKVLHEQIARTTCSKRVCFYNLKTIQ
jgi:acetamidase/formamidase